MPANYYRYWGKAQKKKDKADNKIGDAYHLLVYHLLDVAAVGSVLLQNHTSLRKHLARLTQLNQSTLTKWCVFLLGLHDIGKFAESFQQLRPDLRDELWPDDKISLNNYIRHDSLGYMLWQSNLEYHLLDRCSDLSGFIENDVSKLWMSPIFGHHGWPPDKSELIHRHFNDSDMKSATKFFDDWFAFVAPDTAIIRELAKNRQWRKNQALTSWALSGFAVFCDWLGSDSENFKFNSGIHDALSLEGYWQKIALPNATNAIEQINTLPKKSANKREFSRFFPEIAKATPLQVCCDELDVSNPSQLCILEDVTGAGKTEAALILAHNMMAQGHADGIYIGLPTMATANAMYERMVDVYHRLYADGRPPNLILSHTARHLSKCYQDSLLAPEPQITNFTKAADVVAQCNQWLADNRKKALLADVGIGTIDQVLLSVMPARHQSLRLLGLCNKVLILDEVHAYDAYTSELMKNVVRFHSALGGNTILLTATLTQKQREEMIAAYFGETYASQTRTTNTEYPLLTQIRANQPVVEKALMTRESVKREVAVEFLHHENEVLALIKDRVAAGQCVCWVRNTVGDARDAWQKVREGQSACAENVHLFHSRFAFGNRLAIEEEVLERFGNLSTSEKRKGQVLIATQVVEQSLDLDFDVMITDLAPIDLLIQRAGRLQRHRRDIYGNRLFDAEQKDERQGAILTVFSPPLTESPNENWYRQRFPGGNAVYPHTLVLWRTATLLNKMKNWSMPEDARRMLEVVYGDESSNCPDTLLRTTQQAIGDTNAMRDLGEYSALSLYSGYKADGQWDEEAKIMTRLGDESHTIYLARWDGNRLTSWFTEGSYPWDLSSLKMSVRQLASPAPVDNPQLSAALKQLRKEEKLFDEHSFILPLTLNSESSWEGSAIANSSKTVKVVYDKSQGLLIMDA